MEGQLITTWLIIDTVRRGGDGIVGRGHGVDLWRRDDPERERRDQGQQRRISIQLWLVEHGQHGRRDAYHRARARRALVVPLLSEV